MNPGTVSKILWHFTGGPEWNVDLNKQNTKPKDQLQAYKILKQILHSKHLKLSSYDEHVKIVIPKISYYDWKEKKKIIRENVRKKITSSKVVCLADIPLQHLGYHAETYEKFAIGFHREAALKSNFNPVFYTLDTSNIVNSIYSGVESVNSIDFDKISSAIEDIESEVGKIQNIIEESKINDYDADDIISSVQDIHFEIDGFVSSKKDTLNSFANFVAFVKTFEVKQFNSIYCEREWRSLKQFNFQTDDIAMIVLPKMNGYYEDLINSKLIPNNIPIIPWEDIIEH